MFFKSRKSKFVEKEPYYWEEKSYMMVIPKNQDEDLLKNAIERLENLSDIELIENHYKAEENVIYFLLKYKEEEYEVGIYAGGVSIPEYYLDKNFLFTEEERAVLINAQKALTIFMKFKQNPQESYHLELKLSLALVPDLVGILDESAEKVVPARWVRLAANSNVTPNPRSLFSVQAVTGEDKKVWLHTHGLNRCGITELEILESDVLNYQSHYNLITTYALYLLDKKDELNPLNSSAYIGRLANGEPVVATHVSWTEGILKYKKLDLGGEKDRKEGHNSHTSIVFLFQSEEDEVNKNYKLVSIYDKLWKENPIFFFSNKETERMRALALERFDYCLDAFKNKDNHILIKIGLPLKEEGKFEHIWFELLEVKGKKFKAKLTQEPYDVDDIHTGDIRWYTKDDVTDWIIYTKDLAINPDNIYLLED